MIIRCFCTIYEKEMIKHRGTYETALQAILKSYGRSLQNVLLWMRHKSGTGVLGMHNGLSEPVSVRFEAINVGQMTSIAAKDHA